MLKKLLNYKKYMLHKINHLENKIKKNHFFLKILTDIPKKSVIFAHGLISLVILNFVFFDMLRLKCDKFQKLYKRYNANVRVTAGEIICITGIITTSATGKKSAILVRG